MATFTNKATLSYNGGSVDSNIVTGEILEVLSLTKGMAHQWGEMPCLWGVKFGHKGLELCADGLYSAKLKKERSEQVASCLLRLVI